MEVLETTIVKVGNSLGARYSQDYLAKAGIKEGDRVEVTLRKATPNTGRALKTLRSIAAQNGPLSKIDVEKWEAERAADYAKQDKERRDILGR